VAKPVVAAVGLGAGLAVAVTAGVLLPDAVTTGSGDGDGIPGEVTPGDTGKGVEVPAPAVGVLPAPDPATSATAATPITIRASATPVKPAATRRFGTIDSQPRLRRVSSSLATRRGLGRDSDPAEMPPRARAAGAPAPLGGPNVSRWSPARPCRSPLPDGPARGV
jgi:hypothetical protein